MQGVYRGRPVFDTHYGIEIESAGGDEARGRVPVHDGVRQPAGLVHGGVYASMAESLAVAGTQAATGRVAVGHSSQTSFLRPITEGTVHASGHPRHRGRSTWVWEFDVTDDDGRLCALVRMTVAVRDAA
jgi:1,4-dihydroxy-2-naphthoyl-CoA hydrolase